MSLYLKALVAILTGVSTWGVTAVADGHVDTVELFGLLGVVAGGLGVYAAKNQPTEPADDGGQADTVLLLLVAILFGVALLCAGVLPPK